MPHLRHLPVDEGKLSIVRKEGSALGCDHEIKLELAQCKPTSFAGLVLSW